MDVSSGIRNSKNRKLNEEHDMDGSSNSLGNFPDEEHDMDGSSNSIDNLPDEEHGMDGSSNSIGNFPDEEHDMDGSRNSIGNLPDAILQHILSLLPTNDAVRTSILSKRWQYLWTSIPNLEFKQGLPAKRMLFMNFVERVLVLRDSSNVEMFFLSCDVLNDASRIDAWISAAVRRKVKKIYIYLSNFEEPFVLPHRLFTCDSLTMLLVQMTYILKLPPSICFSSLKILALKDVTFSDDYSTQQLFSGCPVLEELSINRCNWENIKAVSISAPKLWRLIIYDDDDYETESRDCQVMIFGTSLKYLSFTGELCNDYCLNDSSSVVEACIEVIGWDQRISEIAYRVKKLLRGLSNVNDLTLTMGAVEVLDYAEELVVDLPMFNNLTNLQLALWWLDFDLDPRLMDFNCRALLSILQNSPRLKTLVFVEGSAISTSCVEDDWIDDWILDPLPPFFLSYHTSIKVYVIRTDSM